jgi:hypothetical protein
MSGRTETLVLRQSITRRAFTLDAALTILAGCVITIADSACGSSSTSPTPSVVAPADVNGVIAANHGHIAVIMGAQITAGNAVALDIRGTATHTHTVSVSQSDLATLRNRQPVTITSTTDASHSHAVTFTPS